MVENSAVATKTVGAPGAGSEGKTNRPVCSPEALQKVNIVRPTTSEPWAPLLLSIVLNGQFDELNARVSIQARHDFVDPDELVTGSELGVPQGQNRAEPKQGPDPAERCTLDVVDHIRRWRAEHNLKHCRLVLTSRPKEQPRHVGDGS
jgi:hypothetical protein